MANSPTSWVPTEGMLASESGRERALLKGIHDRVGRLKHLLEYNPHRPENLGQEHGLGSSVEDGLGQLGGCLTR